MAPSARDRFVARANELGLSPEITTYPAGTRTAADAAAAIGCDVAQIVKSLVMIADDAPVLVLTSGVNRVDTGKVADAVGAAAARMATPDEVRDATGYAIGGTPPVGHPAPLRTLMDEHLRRHDRVWAAAGTPDSVFPLAPDRLVEITGARVVDVAEPSA